MTVIRKAASFNLLVYHPKTEEGREILSRLASDIHADAVQQRLKSLNCPAGQKLNLLNSVIETAKHRSREQT